MLVDRVVQTGAGLMAHGYDPVTQRGGWWSFAGYADDGVIELEPLEFRAIARYVPNPEAAPDVAQED